MGRRGVFSSFLFFAVMMFGIRPEEGGKPLVSFDNPPMIPPAFADAPAVVLSDYNSWIPRPTNNSSFFSMHKRVLIQTREGFAQADQTVIYNAKFQRLTNFLAQTVKKNKTKVAVPQDLIQDRVTYKNGETELHALKFTFPGVEIGAVLEWQYAIETKGHYLLTTQKWWEVQQDIPVLEATFSAFPDAPKKYIPFSVQPFSRVPYKLWCGNSQKNDSIFTCINVPPFRAEPQQPPGEDLRLKILFSVQQSDFSPHRFWRKILDYWNEKVVRFTKTRSATEKAARASVEQNASASEKMSRVLNYLKDNVKVRPLAFTKGLEDVEGECKNVDEVLARGGGLPREVTLTAQVMLEAVGVEAVPAFLVDRTHQSFVYEMPDLAQLEDLILRVRGEDGGFLDPSCDYCQGVIPDWRYAGAGGGGLLVTPGQNVVRVKVPVATPDQNVEQTREIVELQPGGSALVRGEMTWRTQRDISMRRRWEDLTEAGRREDFLKRLPADPATVKLTLPNPQVLEQPMTVGYEYLQDGLAIVYKDALLVRPGDPIVYALFPIVEQRNSD